MLTLAAITDHCVNLPFRIRRNGLRAQLYRLLALVLIIFFLLPGANKSLAQSYPIRVYFYPPWNISKLPMYMAHDAGVFERDGLNISWTDPGSNEKLLAALKRGDADIAVISANHVAQNNASGGPALKLVGNTGFNYSAFFATAAIKSAADLKGKKIGSGEPGSTPDQLTRLALGKLGLDADKDVILVRFDEGRNRDRVEKLLSGEIAAMLITAEAIYGLEKSGAIKRLNRLADHRQLKIYAGGGADYAMSALFLKSRREDAMKFMAGICDGIALAKNDQAKALSFVAKSGRNLDAAAIDYLYRLYISEVIPARPHINPEGVDLAIQMSAALMPGAASMKASDLVDAELVPQLEKSGRCNN